MNVPPGPPPFGGHGPQVNNQNQAGGNAHVENQIGAIFGETTFHRNEYVYNVNQGDSPERKHEVAFNHLNGGTPRFAENLFGELLWSGHATTERAYYYVISVLSGRPFKDIQGDLHAHIVHARKIAASLSRDAWWEALDVVWRLLRGMRHDTEGSSLKRTLDDFGRLQGVRQDEITRHLDTILDGVVQEGLEAAYTGRVVAERMRPNRPGRAWKFFEPEPAVPREAVPQPTRPEQADWVRVVLGSLGILVGLASVPAGPLGVGALIGALMLLGGAVLVVRYGAEREVFALRLAVRERQVVPPMAPAPPRSPGHWVTTAFVKEVHRLVDVRFSEARPHIAGEWPAYTAGFREYLKRRLVDLYGNARVTPASINWLIRWYAHRVAKGWDNQELFAHRRTMVAPSNTTMVFVAGVVASAVALLVLMAAGQGGAAFFFGLGGFFAAKGVIRVLGLRNMDSFLRAEAAQLYADEVRAHQEWLAVLADRPTDAEMGRWLAMDKLYLKADAIRRAGLTRDDVVAHVVMTEGAPGAQRARYLGGPPRYSAYVVQLFLLTRSGVREARVELDFLRGEARNEQRNLFRYETIASATVDETGMRTTRDRGMETIEVERLRRRTFRLTLVNNRDITVVAENFREAGDTTEDESVLFLMALEASGIVAALPTLEAVAAEGSDWIAREEERRRLWSADWYE